MNPTSYQHYYAVKDAAIVKAAKKHFDELRRIREKQNAFAKKFGGVAYHSQTDQRLLGIGLTKHDWSLPRDEQLWAQRDKWGCTHPKKTGGGAKGDALRAKWEKHFPRDRIPENVLMTALGVPEFDPGRKMEYALVGKTVYVSTNRSFNHGTEILASAYAKAVAA